MNLVLISLDTLRADRLRCYGHHRLTSPNIDRVASEGALFESHYSPHIPTYPGHTTMMTGRDVYAHQVTCQSQAYLPTPGVPMLAEILKTAGYYTSAADNLGKWFTRGFDVYESYTWDTSLPEGWRKAEAVNETAMRVLRSAAAQSAPFFVFLHYWDAHTPYLPPRPFHRLFYTGDETSPENRSMDRVWACEEFRDYFREWMPDVTDIEFPKAQYDAEIAYMECSSPRPKSATWANCRRGRSNATTAWPPWCGRWTPKALAAAPTMANAPPSAPSSSPWM